MRNITLSTCYWDYVSKTFSTSSENLQKIVFPLFQLVNSLSISSSVTLLFTLINLPFLICFSLLLTSSISSTFCDLESSKTVNFLPLKSAQLFEPTKERFSWLLTIFRMHFFAGAIARSVAHSIPKNTYQYINILNSILTILIY